MADAKITALTELTTPVGADLIAVVDDVAVTPITKKITLTNLGIIDGWIPASETWTYASATTITVPSGAASKYVVSDKWKLTANSVVLQGYIVGVADTVLTVAGDALTNHTFTANSYSHASSPIGFPQWFAHDGNVTGFSGTPTEYLRFNINQRTVHLEFDFDGTSNATTLAFTAPVTASNWAVGNNTGFPSGQVFDNGGALAVPGMIQITMGSTTVDCFKTVAGGAWTNANRKFIRGDLFYEI